MMNKEAMEYVNYIRNTYCSCLFLNSSTTKIWIEDVRNQNATYSG